MTAIHVATRPTVGRVDPRTVLLTLVVVNTAVLGVGTLPAMLLTALLALGLIATSGPSGPRRALIIAIVYAAMLLGVFLPPVLGATGAWGTFSASLLWIFRFAVPLTVGAWAVLVIQPAELMAALRKMRFPNWVSIPLAVFLRILPVILVESRAIGEAMTLRGIRPGPTSFFLHPVRAGEMLLIPLLSTVVRCGDELAAAAMIRGLGGPHQPTTATDLRFKVADALLMAALAAVTATMFLTIPGGPLAR